MQTRLADIAQQAQVSTATVSRVLNGRPGVSGATRQSVLAALDMLGYERPASLTTKSVGLVGLVVPELTNPVFPAFVDAIEQRLSEERFTPLLCTQSPGGTSEDRYVEVLLDHAVNGIVFVSGLHADKQANLGRYQRLRNSGVPIVLVNGYNAEIDAPFVSTDDEAAIDASVDHLVALGHRRIGLAIGPDRFVPTRRKVAAFAAALARHGLDDGGVHVSSSLYTAEGGQAAATDLLDSGHTAIVCGSDLMALGAIRAVRSNGLRVPRGRVRARVRRLPARRVRRPAADHRPAARRRDLPGRRRRAPGRDARGEAVAGGAAVRPGARRARVDGSSARV